MRRLAFGLLLLSLHVGLLHAVRAADDDPAAIIDKAVKAHFPKGVDKTHLATRSKSKGTLHLMGMDLDYNQEVAVQLPNKLKETMDLEVMGKKINVVSVYNGKEAWIKSGDNNVPVNDEILAEFKEATYSIGLLQGMFLKDKDLALSLVGESKVKDKPTIAVKISRKGKKDITLYFDKETGLIAKVEMRKRDFQSGQEVNEERIITEYQEVSGRKIAKKIEVLRDGKPFLEGEVTSVEVLEKLDDNEFAKP